MSLPFRRHLEWLVIEGMNLQEVQKFYDNIQLPLPTEEDMELAEAEISRKMVPPGLRRKVSKKIYKAAEAPIWDKLGYGDLFRWRCGHASPEWSQVGRVLNHPLMRTSLDCCIIINMDPDKVEAILPQVFGLPISLAAQDLYKKYFGAFESFDKDSWGGYLERLVEDQYVYTRVFAALTRPKDEVLHLLGLPTEKQFSDFLKNVLATANYKFNYYSRQGTVEADVVAMDWAKVGIVSGEKYEKFGAGDATDFAKLVQTEFEFVTPAIETLSPELALSMRPKTQGEGDK